VFLTTPRGNRIAPGALTVDDCGSCRPKIKI
jgi:hypothetical protein